MGRIEVWGEDVPDLKIGDEYQCVVTGRVAKITEQIDHDKVVELAVYRLRVGDGPEIKPWYIT